MLNLYVQTKQKKLRKLIAKPLFARHALFDNDLAALHMYNNKLYLNRPIYVGMIILDLSKLLMYNFYYNHMKQQYLERCQLLYTDTDSLLMQIETDDIYQDMLQHIDDYDTSDYPKDHYLHSTNNLKVPGKMKDECVPVN